MDFCAIATVGVECRREICEVGTIRLVRKTTDSVDIRALNLLIALSDLFLKLQFDSFHGFLSLKPVLVARDYRNQQRDQSY